MYKSNEAHFLFVSLLIFISLFSSILATPLPAPANKGTRNFSRPDPLRGFKKYHGGYNIQDKHYWASTAFTGVHGYAIAGGWMLCGLGFGIYLALKTYLPITDHPNHHYVLSFLMAVLFICLAIVATGFVLASNQQSYQRTKKLLRTISGIGEDASRRIREVSTSIEVMQQLLLPYDPKKSQMLNVTTRQLEKESRIVEDFVYKRGHAINNEIKILYVAHVVFVSSNSVLLIAALGILLLHWHLGLTTVIVLCWILTTIFWTLTGIDFFILTLAGDTCSAFKEFEQNPHNNSLTSMLPCMLSNSNKFLTDIGRTVHNFISEVNSRIGVLKICDPFTGPPRYNYIPENCPNNAVPIVELPYVLSKFVCYKGNSSKTCKNEGKFLPEEAYNLATAYSQSIAKFFDIYPDLENLLRCSFVKDAVSEVVLHQCGPLKTSTRFLWSSILCLSIIMVFLILTLVAKSYQDRGKCFSRFGILPTTV